jgi:AGZA family xanthine/uracil permease-like MFS transporter
MFLLCIFFAPVAAIIPAPATSAALIYVGIIMLQGLKKINMDDMDQVVPVFIMLIAMPVSGSIGHGIGLAMISYTFLKIFFGEAKDVSLLTLFISALFIVKFFVVA